MQTGDDNDRQGYKQNNNKAKPAHNTQHKEQQTDWEINTKAERKLKREINLKRRREHFSKFEFEWQVA